MIIVEPSCLKDADGARTHSDQWTFTINTHKVVWKFSFIIFLTIIARKLKDNVCTVGPENIIIYFFGKIFNLAICNFCNKLIVIIQNLQNYNITYIFT